MNELVIMHDQQAVTTSLILAEAFEKEHSKVIRSIEQKINGAKNGLVKNMFAEATYLDTKGEQFIRSLLEDESIVPVLERPSQMMIEEDTTEYDGVWFTASEIAWKLNLNPKQYAKHIGRIANDCKLKPIFTDHNRYCRKIVDEYGRESYEYTAQGAMIIEKKIMEEMEA